MSMPQVDWKQLVGKLDFRRFMAALDRRRLIVASVIAVVGLGSWLLLREKPRAVADPDWDNIVFAETASLPVPDVEPLPDPPEQGRHVTPQTRAESRGLRMEVAANTALQLDADWRPAPRSASPANDAPSAAAPTRLEGGIELIGASTH